MSGLPVHENPFMIHKDYAVFVFLSKNGKVFGMPSLRCYSLPCDASEIDVKVKSCDHYPQWVKEAKELSFAEGEPVQLHYLSDFNEMLDKPVELQMLRNICDETGILGYWNDDRLDILIDINRKTYIDNFCRAR